VILLANVRLNEGESFESMIRRFTKRVQQEGIISETRRRGFFEKPSIKRKRKAAAKRRKTSRGI
jgi:small subunit ribosomal protein S21